MGAKKTEFVLKSRMVATLIACLLCASFAVTGFMWAQNTVNVNADGKNISVKTICQDAKEILTMAGVVLMPGDEFQLSTFNVGNGTIITVYRAIPVNITYQGKTQSLSMGKATVGELVATAGIPLTGVRLEPSGETVPVAGMDIKVLTLREEIVEREVAEPFTVLHQPDPAMEKGNEEVVTAGEDGVKIVKTRLYYEDEKEVAAEVLTEKVVTLPQPRLIKTGTRDTVETSRGAVRFNSVRTMEATAYTPNDGGNGGLTATGVMAHRGVVAVDPNVIPLGSKVYISGYGVAMAADTGGAIKGDRIDLCMEGYGEAMDFGRRTVRVYLLE